MKQHLNTVKTAYPLGEPPVHFPVRLHERAVSDVGEQRWLSAHGSNAANGKNDFYRSVGSTGSIRYVSSIRYIRSMRKNGVKRINRLNLWAMRLSAC